MTPAPPPPSRTDVVSWLTALGDRPPTPRLDSMELAWLVHQVEQVYGVELADTDLERITTVDEAVTVLHEVLTPHA